jgi:SAM-dependent methyltransferase
MPAISNNTVSFAPSLSEREYAECFDAFKKISSEWLSMQQWLNEDFLQRHVWSSPLKILSIGSGDGDFDLEFMKILMRRWRIETYIAIDPNPHHNQTFESRYRKSNLHVPNFEILPETFPVSHLNIKFDLVHMTHCLYYMPDRLRAIQAALGSLSENGLMLVFHQTQLGINEIQRHFLMRAKGSEYEMYSSRDIYRLLKSLHLSFDYEMLDGMLDVSEFFALPSPRMNQLLNFFLECRADLLTTEFKNEVVSFIKNLAIVENGRQVILHPVGVFCISRSFIKPTT